MKNERQEMILRLIERYDIDTQEELIDRLAAAGFPVTQSTASRDIRQLKLVKVTTASGVYKYAAPNAAGITGNHPFKNTLTDSILRVDWVLNQIVIRTTPGLAQAIAGAIDHLERQEILGCVAGDDTIIVVTRSTEAAADTGRKIRDLIRNLG